MMKKIVLLLLGLVTIACVLLISVYLIVSGMPAIREIGPIEFLFGTQWSSTSADPRFGILPFILISIYGTAGAMVIGVPVGFLNAVYAAKPASARVKRLLTVKPEVLLMDESTSALDPISTQRIEELAVSLRRRYTIVIVTHNMQQACRISTRTAFFLMGRLVEYGDTRQLFENPVQKETEDYVDGRFG